MAIIDSYSHIILIVSDMIRNVDLEPITAIASVSAPCQLSTCLPSRAFPITHSSLNTCHRSSSSLEDEVSVKNIVTDRKPDHCPDMLKTSVEISFDKYDKMKHNIVTDMLRNLGERVIGSSSTGKIHMAAPDDNIPTINISNSEDGLIPDSTLTKCKFANLNIK